MNDPGALGVTFSPSNQQTNASGTAPLVGFDGLPSEIQMLSLRLPKVVGAQALAPEALLAGKGSAARPDLVSSVVQSVLKSLGIGALPATPGQTSAQLAAARGLPVPPATSLSEAGQLGTQISHAASLPPATPHIEPVRAPTAPTLPTLPPLPNVPPAPSGVAPRPAIGGGFGFGNHPALA
jgi:hypothetical protein